MAKEKAWVIVPSVDEEKGYLIDIYPLILCEDCKFYHSDSCQCNWSQDVDHDNWFCADGERKG